MTAQNDAARAEILARLAQSREELRSLLDPPRREPGADGSAIPGSARGFPRSRTMQLLMGERGLGILGAVAAGLLMARPGLALRLLRTLPASGLAKMLLMRAFTALRSKHESRRD